MYAYIIGQVTDMGEGFLIVENQGIGYQVSASAFTLSDFSIGKEGKIYTRYVVREDSVSLYGFSTERERDMFDLLTRVSAVGPKLALAILSTIPVDGILQAVQNSDVTMMTKAPGVGKKTASRILLELTDPVRDWKTESPTPVVTQNRIPTDFLAATEALMNFGYPRNEAEKALHSLPEGLSLTEMIRTALQRMG